MCGGGVSSDRLCGHGSRSQAKAHVLLLFVRTRDFSLWAGWLQHKDIPIDLTGTHWAEQARKPGSASRPPPFRTRRAPSGTGTSAEGRCGLRQRVSGGLEVRRTQLILVAKIMLAHRVSAGTAQTPPPSPCRSGLGCVGAFLTGICRFQVL